LKGRAKPPQKKAKKNSQESFGMQRARAKGAIRGAGKQTPGSPTRWPDRSKKRQKFNHRLDGKGGRENPVTETKKKTQTEMEAR